MTALRRARPWWLLVALPLVASVLLAFEFVSTMEHTGERVAGNNAVKLQQPVVQVPGGSRLCQAMLVPRDAAAALFFVAPTGPTGPPLTLTMSQPGVRLPGGRVAGGWTGGAIKIPFRRVTATAPGASVCVRNDGRRALAFAGFVADVPTTLTLDGKRQKASITVQFFRPGRSSYWSLLPTIAHRNGVMRGSLSGSWGFWFAVALFAVAALLALGIALRGIFR